MQLKCGREFRMNLVKLLLMSIVAMVGMVCLAQDAVTKDASANAQKVKLPKLLDLGSKKCIPCKMMAPVLEKLEKEYAGIMNVEFIDVWLEENAAKAEKYGIETIPTQIFFDADGKELDRHVGYISEEDIFKKWKELGFDFENLNKKKNSKSK